MNTNSSIGLTQHPLNPVNGRTKVGAAPSAVPTEADNAVNEKALAHVEAKGHRLAESAMGQPEEPRGFKVVDEAIALDVVREIEQVLQESEKPFAPKVARIVIDRLFNSSLKNALEFEPDHQTLARVEELLSEIVPYGGYARACLRAECLRECLFAAVQSGLPHKYSRMLPRVAGIQDRSELAVRAFENRWSKQTLEKEVRAVREKKRGSNPMKGRPLDTWLTRLSKLANQAEAILDEEEIVRSV